MNIGERRVRMRKIGGVNMNTTVHYKFTKYSIQESLKQSIKEVKLIKKGQIKTKTWRELLNDLKENKE